MATISTSSQNHHHNPLLLPQFTTTARLSPNPPTWTPSFPASTFRRTCQLRSPPATHLRPSSSTPSVTSFQELVFWESMESPSFQFQFQFPLALRSPRCLHYEKSNVPLAKNLGERLTPLVVKKVPRRLLFQLLGFIPILVNVCPVLAAPPQEMDPEVIRSMKLPSGVRIQDIVDGEGPEAREGDLVEVNYVCRRSNGYFVHSTVDQFSGESSPVILPLDETQIIKGLKDVLIGMKVGGKRRALIPPSVGYTNQTLRPIPDEFGPRRSLLSHVKEPLIFEVQLLKVL